MQNLHSSFFKQIKNTSYKSIQFKIPVILLGSIFLPDSLANMPTADMKEEKILLLHEKSDSLVDYAMSLEGIPYKFAGKSFEGLDCSGFNIMYTISLTFTCLRDLPISI